GIPDEIESSADGRSFVWTYHNFHPSAAVAPGNLYRTTIKDPLEEIRDAWVNNQSRYDQLTRPPDEQKRSDQSWSDYAKSNPADRALRNPLEQQVNRQREMPEPDSLPQ